MNILILGTNSNFFGDVVRRDDGQSAFIVLEEDSTTRATGTNPSTGMTVEFLGTGLPLDMSQPLTGTVTSMNFVQDGVLQGQFTDISWDFGEIMQALSAISFGNDFDPLLNLFDSTGGVTLDASVARDSIDLFTDRSFWLELHVPLTFVGVTNGQGGRDGLVGTFQDDDFTLGDIDTRLFSTPGNDTIRFSPGESYESVFLDQNFFTQAISVDIDGTANTGSIFTSAGTHTLLNVINVLDDFTLFVTGTQQDDEFDIDLAPGQSITLTGLEGIDSYTLFAGENAVIEIEFGWYGDVSGTDGVWIDVGNGFVYNDGFGTAESLDFSGPGVLSLVGSPRGDWLIGSDGSSDLFGSDGNDTLEGRSGNDWLEGGDGNDRIDGGAGDDDLFGGLGIDLIFTGGGMDRVAGTVAEMAGDRITDLEVGDSVEVFGALSALGDPFVVNRDRATGVTTIDIGDDGSTDLTFTAEGEFDFFIAQEMDNGDGVSIWLDAAYDPLTTFFGTFGPDNIFGTLADERFFGEDGNDTLNGFHGDDTINGGVGADLMIGGPGSDVIHVDDAGDRVSESRKWAGHDTVISSVDFRMGRAHIEDLELTGTARLGAGNGLANRITGNDVDNLLDGGTNNDTLIGGLGDDTYLVRAPGDTVVEEFSEGIDTVRAFRSYALEAHVERLFMQTVFTKDGNPAIFNGIGNGLDNTIVGTPFANTIVGREGRDTLKGQAGADAFVFDRALGANNVDRIIDFNTNEANEGDILKMKGSVFGGMSAGALAAADFVAGTAALDASDRFIFDQASGQLWFDADGSGAGAQVLVATFEQNAQVTAADIEIF